MRSLPYGIAFGGALILLLALFFSSIKSSRANDPEYQRRLSNLRENQAQTQAMLNQLGGFSSPKLSGSRDDEDDSKKRPLFRVHSELRANRVPTGSVFHAYNQNRLIIGGEASPAILKLDDSQGNLSGLKLIANAHPSGTEGRIHLEINRLILRSGRVVTISAIGLDQAGSQGLQAHVFSGKALSIIGSIASSFVSGVAASQQTQSTNAFGFTQNQTTGRNAILGGVAQTAADQSKRLIDEATSEKPVLILDEGTPIAVFFQEEVKF